MSIISEETNYSKIQSQRPQYHLSKLTQQSGGNSVTLSSSGGEQSIFEIPTNVVNLSRSVLEFTITAAAQTTDFVGLYTGGTVAAIRDIELYTKNGVRLCNIPNVHKYLQVARMTDTPLSEFLSNSQSSGLYRSNATSTGSDNYRFGVAAGSAAALANARQANQISYTEPTYIESCGADNTALAVQFRIPMSAFKNTILDLDKDLYFAGEIVYLRVTWAPTTVIGGDGDADTFVNQGDLATTPTLTTLNFYLAVEKNQGLANQIINQVVTNGMAVLVDYVHAYNQNLTGTSQTFSLRFSRSAGQRLRKIYSIPYIGSNTAHSNYYNHVWDQDAEAITALYTMLNNERIQQWNMVTPNDEYMVMEDMLKGSVIQNAEMFAANYFFIDSFDGLRTIERQPNMVAGLPLDVEQKYDIVATTEAQRNWYVFAVCQRNLHISPGNIVLD